MDGGCIRVSGPVEKELMKKVDLPNQYITIFKTNRCSEILKSISMPLATPVPRIYNYWYRKTRLWKKKIFDDHFDVKYRLEWPVRQCAYWGYSTLSNGYYSLPISNHKNLRTHVIRRPVRHFSYHLKGQASLTRDNYLNCKAWRCLLGRYCECQRFSLFSVSPGFSGMWCFIYTEVVCGIGCQRP